MEPPTLILKNEQKQELFDGIQNRGFNPEDFELALVPLGQVFGQRGQTVKYKGSTYKFGICKNMADYTPAKFIIEYSPGREELTETEECWSWPAVSMAFDSWLGFLEKELKIGDPWKSLKKFSAQVESMPATQKNKGPASKSDIAVIQTTLDEIKQLLLKQVADDEKKKQYLDERFQVLTDAATRFSKRDYLMLIYEVAIGIAVNIGTRPDVISQITTLLHGLLAKIPHILALP